MRAGHDLVPGETAPQHPGGHRLCWSCWCCWSVYQANWPPLPCLPLPPMPSKCFPLLGEGLVRESHKCIFSVHQINFKHSFRFNTWLYHGYYKWQTDTPTIRTSKIFLPLFSAPASLFISAIFSQGHSWAGQDWDHVRMRCRHVRLCYMLYRDVRLQWLLFACPLTRRPQDSANFNSICSRIAW